MRRSTVLAVLPLGAFMFSCRGTESSAPAPVAVHSPRLLSAADSAAFQNSGSYGAAQSSFAATVVTTLQLQPGDWLLATVTSTDCSGDPESVNVGGVISGMVFSGSCLTLTGTQRVIGPATAYGTVYFTATHPSYGTGPRGQVTGTEPDYSVGLNDGYGDTDYNDVVLSVSLTPPPAAGTCVSPVLSGAPPITTIFGVTDASHKKPHTGRDYGVPTGTPVYAPEAGVVKHRGNTGSAGIAVVIQGSTRNSYFFHLESIAVAYNQAVSAGDLLGYTDNTGHSTGPHLHFEQHTPGPIWVKGVAPRATAIEPCTF
jgi:murein DD-endopeptidase MepM/ murein hydrolase activator NlpD